MFQIFLMKIAGSIPDKKGLELIKSAKFAQAINSFDKVIAKTPDYSTFDVAYLWYGKGFALSKLGRFEEAIKSFNSALERTPYFPMRYTGRV